jgi:hypothetical protein
LADLVEAYRDLLSRPPADLSRLVELSSTSDTPSPLRAWLYVARIASLPEDRAAEREILFEALDNNIPREAMSSYVLTRLSEWYAAQGDPLTAAELREYLLETRRDEAGFEHVLLAVAQQESESNLPEVQTRALERFREVLERSEDDEELAELAQLGLARIHTKQEDWARAEKAWGRYLAERDWVAARAEANFGYARSIEGGGNTRKALGYYVSIYSNFAGQLDWSTQAYLRAARIMDAQGKRKEALLILQDMLRRMHTKDHPGVDEAKKQFNQWRDEFVNSQ